MLSQNAAITDATIPEDEKSKIKKQHKKYGGYCYEKIKKLLIHTLKRDFQRSRRSKIYKY